MMHLQLICILAKLSCSVSLIDFDITLNNFKNIMNKSIG